MTDNNCTIGSMYPSRKEEKAKIACGELILESMTKKEEKKINWLPLIWVLIALTILCALVGTVKAQELVASYYDTASLHRDGQWKITKGVMANGELFRDNDLTVASCDFPLGTRLHIIRGSKSVAVSVTDRTARRFKGKRIDLTPRVFKMLSPSGTTKEGLLKVSVEAI